MKVALEDLNEWARLAFRVNGRLLKIMSGRKNSGDLAAEAQSLIALLIRQLKRAGASDPGLAIMEQERGPEFTTMFAPKEIPIELLSSMKAKQYAEAMRAAAEACKAMEEERYGVGVDGSWEYLADLADDAELEVFGPVGLRGLE